jgi:diacylglycerol kinase family enzyme
MASRADRRVPSRARTLRRLAAVASLTLGLASLPLAVALAVVDFPRGMYRLGLLVLGAVCVWHGLIRRGAGRALGVGTGALLIAGYLALMVLGRPWLLLALLLVVALGALAGRAAFRIAAALPKAPRPARAVLFFNPRSGGGKATRFHLAQEAAARGITAIELVPGADLEQLVRAAVDRGADALAMAGGDGSQAIVARIAAERGLPYACIPSGTRNHFALDLGVDRDDVVGALDAFVDGGERRVDLGEVNGRTFVNNVSLGVYGEAVQRSAYRGAKLRTLVETMPDVLGPDTKPQLRWRDANGVAHEGGAAILVSNNRYRLGNSFGSGTRPRLDDGTLGVAVVGAPGEEPRAWTTPTFEIDAQRTVPAGIDGEASQLEPPLRFRVRSSVLRCRIAAQHPGASPSAFAPDGAWDAVRTLIAIALGHDVGPLPGAPRPVQGT